MPEIVLSAYNFIKSQYIASIEKEKNFRDLTNIAKGRLSRCIDLKVRKDCPEYIHIKNRAYFLTKLYRAILNEMLLLKSKWEMVKMCTVKRDKTTIEDNKKKVKICLDMNQVFVFDS